MDPTTVGVIGLFILIIVLFSRMPVGFVMALVGFLGFCYLRSPEAGLRILAKDFFDIFGSYSLTVVPLFIFMGQIAFHAGISRRLYDSAYTFLGHLQVVWPWPLLVRVLVLPPSVVPPMLLQLPWPRWPSPR